MSLQTQRDKTRSGLINLQCESVSVSCVDAMPTGRASRGRNRAALRAWPSAWPKASFACLSVGRSHYIELLAREVRRRGLDTLPILTADDLETVVRRSDKRLPPNPYGTPPSAYRQALLQVLCEKPAR